MTDAPLLSVIIPFKNDTVIFDHLIKSARALSSLNIEVIAVNDQSCDKCLLSVSRALYHLQCSTSLFSSITRGPGAARNAGLHKSRGTYVVFCDADDTFDLAGLENLAVRMKASNADLAIFNFTQCKSGRNTGPRGYAEQFGGKAVVLAGLDQKSVLYRQFTYCWDKIYARESLIRNSVIFPPGLYEDIPVSVLAIYHANAVLVVDQPLACHFLYESSTIRAHSPDHVNVIKSYERALNVIRAKALGGDGERAFTEALIIQAAWHGFHVAKNRTKKFERGRRKLLASIRQFVKGQGAEVIVLSTDRDNIAMKYLILRFSVRLLSILL